MKNRMPNVTSALWKPVSPATKQIATFERDIAANALCININSERFGVGKWISEVPIEPGKSYDFSVTAESGCHVNDLYVIITTFRADGSMIIREHAHCHETLENGYRFLHKVEAGKDSVKLSIELWLKGYQGSVSWHVPLLTDGEALQARNVGIAVAYIPPKAANAYTLESNTADILEALEESAKHHPDIILLGEAMYTRGTGLPLSVTAQTDDGAMCRLMAQKATEYNTYIVYNLQELDDGEYYNTSILFDRQGKIVGKYRKTHLTVTELELGMTPGTEHPVFDTDFGKVGMLVCYDHYFSKPVEQVAANGAEILLISSAGDAAEQCFARAKDCGLYVAVCGWNTENSYGWAPGRIIDANGNMLSGTREKGKPAFAKIDLNKPVRRHWLSLGNADMEIHSVYKYEKNVHCK